MGHVVQFYIWAIENHHLIVSDEKAAPFTLEFTTRTNRGLLAHLHPRIIVQTSDLRIRLPRNSNAIPLTPLTKAHLTTLSRYLKHEPVEFILMVLLACDSGLRLREVCSFTLDALMQARTACASGTRFQLTISPMNGVDTKFKKKRTIEMSATLLTLLQRYSLSERRLNRLSKLQDKITSLDTVDSLREKNRLRKARDFEPLFISQQGNCVQPEVLNARWVAFRNNLSRIDPGFRYRFHDLRSTYATYRLDSLLNNGVSEGEALDCIMGWMGHNSEKVTFRYIRFFEAKRNAEIRLFITGLRHG